LDLDLEHVCVLEVGMFELVVEVSLVAQSKGTGACVASRLTTWDVHVHASSLLGRTSDKSARKGRRLALNCATVIPSLRFTWPPPIQM